MRALKDCVLKQVCPGDDGVARNVLWRGVLRDFRKDSREIWIMGVLDEIVSLLDYYAVFLEEQRFRELGDKFWKYAFKLTATAEEAQPPKLPPYVPTDVSELYCDLQMLLAGAKPACGPDIHSTAAEMYMRTLGAGVCEPARCLFLYVAGRGKLDKCSKTLAELAPNYKDVQVSGWFRPKGLQSARLNVARAYARRLERFLVERGDLAGSAVVNKFANLLFATAVAHETPR